MQPTEWDRLVDHALNSPEIQQGLGRAGMSAEELRHHIPPRDDAPEPVPAASGPARAGRHTALVPAAIMAAIMLGLVAVVVTSPDDPPQVVSQRDTEWSTPGSPTQLSPQTPQSVVPPSSGPEPPPSLPATTGPRPPSAATSGQEEARQPASDPHQGEPNLPRLVPRTSEWIRTGLPVCVLISFGWLLFAVRPRRRAALAGPSMVPDDWLDQVVLPAARTELNRRIEPAAWNVLTPSAAPGLYRVQDEELIVDTASVQRFQATVQRVREGAVGLAGPRGAGKSTLMKQHLGKHRNQLSVFVQAPVQYDPRDFVLHLYAELCRSIMAHETGAAGPGNDHPLWNDMISRAARQTARSDTLRYLVFVLIAICGAVAAALPVVLTTISFWDWRLWPAAILATVAIGLLGVFLLRRLGPVRTWVARAYRWLSRGHEDHAIDVLAGLARQELQQVRFLQTHTTGWSGKLTLPLKSEAGWTKTLQLAERPQSYPELVDRLRRFMAQAARVTGGQHGRGLLVGIDEIDKIESGEQAERFISEIKGIFGVPGCQFLVSVSQDALTAFERRRTSVRDAFESAFDEIVSVGFLGAADAADLLRKRVVGFPPPFLYLCHCLAGGLPRELIRVARDMVATADPAGSWLSGMAERLVYEDLRGHLRSLRETAKQSGRGKEVADFVRALQEQITRPDAAAWAWEAGDDAAPADLAVEARVHLRYAETMLAVFRDDLDRQAVRLATANPGGPESFDTLAAVRQYLAVHPSIAESMLDEFRAAWRV